MYDDESHTISTAAEDGYRISTTAPYTINPANAATLTAGEDGEYIVSGVKDQDVEITINFEAIPTATYTVTFNAGTNGTCSTTELTESSAGVGVTLPDCTPNAGYQFVGWATSETATEAEYEAGATYYPTADITLYAVYNQVYTINYMVNGINTGAQVNVEEGTPLVFPTVTAPDADHVFCGWVTEAINEPQAIAPEYVNTENLTASEDATYYAVFAEKSGGEKSESLDCPAGTVSNNEMIFNTTNFEIIHAKGTSSNFAAYSPWRIYQNNTVTVSSDSKTISKMEMVTNSTYNGTWVTTAGTVNVATTSGGTTSVTGINATEVTLTNTGTQARWSNITIYYDDITYSNWCTTIVTKVLTSITIDGEYPTEFWKGEAFSHEGIIVTAHYSNAPDADVTEDATFSTPDMTTVGNKTITVTYDTKSTTYEIAVKTIANTQETAYTVAEAKTIIDANPAELATTKVYVKGTVSKIVTAWDSQYGNITFDVSADGQTTGDQFQFYRNFKDAENTQWASAAECPAVGDDVIGYGKMKKHNSTYEFDAGNYLVSHVKAATLSINDITVEIGGTITPNITTNVPEYTIAYYVASEDVVKVQDGNLVTVAVGGPVEVTATLTAEGYKSAETTFTVEVIKALQSIAVKTAPTTTSYKVGDTFDPAGLVITATYSDESTEDIAYAGNQDKFTFNPDLNTALTAENNQVTITYGGKSTTQTITVRALYTYDITWMANGEEHTTTQVTEGDAVVLPENPFAVGDMTFQGWINMENYYDAEIAPEYIVPSEIIPTGAMTFYAVYAKATEESRIKEFLFSITKDGFTTTSYADNNGSHDFTATCTTDDTKQMTVACTTNQVYQYSSSMQWKSGQGYIYNTTDLGTIKSVEVNSITGTFTTYYGTSEHPTSGTTVGNGFFTVQVGNATGKTSSVEVTFEKETQVIIYSNFCTTVAPIVISENTVWDGNFTINGNTTVTIGSGAVLTVTGTLTNTNAANLIIEDGGQLICNNEVAATVKKSIRAINGSNGWYTIASPVNGSSAVSTVQTTESAYDLYRFNQAANFEWENVKAHPTDFTTLNNGTGYLYANSADVTLEFAGTLRAGNEEFEIELSYASGNWQFKGFNLVGNPFAHNISMGSDVKQSNNNTGYYVVEHGSNLVVKTSETPIIKPCQGFMVQAKGEGQRITFNPSSSAKETQTEHEYITIAAGNGDFMDMAYICTNADEKLGKITLDNPTAKVYLQQNGNDYAIAPLGEATSMVVCFKAPASGTYTINVSSDHEGVSLKDMKTGYVTYVNHSTSYTFEASENDAESRFKIMFGTTGVEENGAQMFVFQSGSNLIISGEGTVQIIDMMGRVLRTAQVESNATVSTEGLTAGAYVVRMLTAGGVQTQKVIVK